MMCIIVFVFGCGDELSGEGFDISFWGVLLIVTEEPEGEPLGDE
jgi:hypothetical protein